MLHISFRQLNLGTQKQKAFSEQVRRQPQAENPYMVRFWGIHYTTANNSPALDSRNSLCIITNFNEKLNTVL